MSVSDKPTRRANVSKDNDKYSSMSEKSGIATESATAAEDAENETPFWCVPAHSGPFTPLTPWPAVKFAHTVVSCRWANCPDFLSSSSPSNSHSFPPSVFFEASATSQQPQH